MAYQVIARKFRPQSFVDFVGQEHVTQTLLNALAQDRFPHALLLTGPRGTGKTSTARIIAKTLLCLDRQNQNPCGVCRSCLDIKEDKHLDVIEIDGASNNGVDHIRELRDTIGYMPSSGAYKIYIIDEVHMLSTSAFNALLKTLEEPPDHVIFIFATTEVQKIPATILSRCQRFDFRNHSITDIKNHLQNICQKENISFEDEALWVISKQAKGSMRDSLTLLDQLISFSQNSLTLQSVMSVLGLTDRALLLEILKAIASASEQNMFLAIDQLKTAGLDPLLFTEEFLETLRNSLLVKMGCHNQKSLEISDSEVEELEKITTDLKVEEIHLLFDVTFSGAQRLASSFDPMLGLEMLLFKLLYLPRLSSSLSIGSTTASTSRTAVKTPASQVQKTTSSAATMGKQTTHNPPVQQNVRAQESVATSSRNAQTQESAKTSSGTERVQENVSTSSGTQESVASSSGQEDSSAQSTVNSTPQIQEKKAAPSNLIVPLPEIAPIGRSWPEFVHAVKQVNGFLGALLEHTSIVEEHKESLQLGLPEKMSFLMDKLKDPKNIERTENFLINFWQDQRKVDFILLKKNQSPKTLSPKEIEEQARLKKQKKESESIESHPLVRAAEDIFKDNITQVVVTEKKSSPTIGSQL